MNIFRKNKINTRPLGKAGSKKNHCFVALADNAFWNTLINKGENLYLVTSSSSREGKTTVAVNLSLNMARRGKKVLLIDANLRNPTVSAIFNIWGSPGLTQYMGNGVSITDVISPINEYNIDIIPSGIIDQEPFDVLTSDRIHNLFNDARRLYDFVIVDCASVNVHADPLLLCSSVNQVIFVVLANKTEKDEVRIAKAKILNMEGKILGVVLNKTNNA